MKTLSPIETAVVYSRKIENILKEDFKAEGQGLHELLTSIQPEIDQQLIKKARYIATTRNKVLHDNDDNFNTLDFHKTASEVIEGLREIQSSQLEYSTHNTSRFGSTDSSKKPDYSKNDISKITLFILMVIALLLIYHNPKTMQKVESPDNNSYSEQTYKIQKRLNELGYRLRKINGINSEQTKSAIYDFQYSNDLAVDGTLDKHEHDLLMSDRAKFFEHY